jgi:hypothetical protein
MNKIGRVYRIYVQAGMRKIVKQETIKAENRKTKKISVNGEPRP